MAVVFDTTVLSLVFNPNAKPPEDPKTKAPLEHAKERVDFLVRTLHEKKTKVIIPSPALCELLIYAADAANEYMTRLRRPPFRLETFDVRAAIECAQYLRKYGIRGKGPDNPRTKIKFDWQVMAIAQVSNAETVYSDDKHIFGYGQKVGIPVVRSFDLELDPDDRQLGLGFETPLIQQADENQ